jgi:hypothetical protein
MTSMEKLQRFITAMDKQCASRQANQSVSISTSNHEANDLDLFDSYSADDIKEFEDEFIENSSPHVFSLPQEKQFLEVYYQPISQKDIFYPGNVPNLSRISCPNLIQAYVYEESTSENENDSIHHHSRRLLFYHKGLSFLHTLRRMLGLQLFRDYRYMLFFISQFSFYLFYDLIYLFPSKFFLHQNFGFFIISSSRLWRNNNGLYEKTNDDVNYNSWFRTIFWTNFLWISSELFIDQ